MSEYSERYSATKNPLVTYYYIAGPMRGIDAYNFPAFFEAEAAVLAAPDVPVTFNPAANDIWTHDLRDITPLEAGRWLLNNPQEFSLRDALGADTAWISKYADVVVVLPGWEGSKGALAEVALARALGIKVWRYTPAGQHSISEDFEDITDAPPPGVDLGYEARLLDAEQALAIKSAVDTIKQTGGAVEIAGVRITPCDEHGYTEGVPSGFCQTCHIARESHLPGQSRWSCAYVDGDTGLNLVDSLLQSAADREARVAARLDEPVLFNESPGTGSVYFDGKSEVRTTSSTGGQKGTKLARYDLIPVHPLRLLAEHYGRGAAKYADNQWRRGYEFSKSIAARTRHFEAWRGGEDFDVCPADGHGCQHVDMDGNEFHGVPSDNGPTCFNHTGSHHLVADLWHGMFLLEGTEHWPQHDDRFKYPEEGE